MSKILGTVSLQGVNSTAKRIYLDVNHWITLSRVRNGLESDPALCTLYDRLDSLSESGRILVLFSLFTVIEASRHRKREGYRRLVDTLVDLSRGHVIKPSSYFLEKEIENAMNGLIGVGPDHDIRSEIVGRGPADMINQTFSDVKGRIPPQFQHALRDAGWSDVDLAERFEALRNDPCVFKECLLYEGFLNGVREAYGDADALIIDAETERHKNSGMNRDEFERRLIVGDLNNNLIDTMSRWAVGRGIPARQAKELLTRDNVEAFRRSMPAHHTRFTLAWARDRKACRSFEPNDLLDIAHLAVAIPYTDMVVTDKMAAYLATSENLDKMYNCVVLDDLEKLARHPVLTTL